MAMDFGFLNPVNAVKKAGKFIEDDPDRFSILAGRLGNILGTGNEALEKAGSFGAELGYSGKIQSNRDKSSQMIQALLGGLTGPNTAGLTGVSADDNNNLKIDVSTGPKPDGTSDKGSGVAPADTKTAFDPSMFGTAVEGSTDISGNDIVSQLETALGGGGGATPAPKPQAAPSTPQRGGELEALQQALSGGTGDARFLTPEMAVRMMANDTVTRRQALDFTNAQIQNRQKGRALDIQEDELVREYDGGVKRDETRVSMNADGTWSADANGPKVMKTSALAAHGVARKTSARGDMTADEARWQNVVGNHGKKIGEMAKRYGTKASSLTEMFSTASDWYQKLEAKFSTIEGKSADALTSEDLQVIQDRRAAKVAFVAQSLSSGNIPPNHPILNSSGAKADLDSGETINVKVKGGIGIRVKKIGNNYRVLGVF